MNWKKFKEEKPSEGEEVLAAYPFNEETESFIRKKFDMPIPEESKEQ